MSGTMIALMGLCIGIGLAIALSLEQIRYQLFICRIVQISAGKFQRTEPDKAIMAAFSNQNATVLR